jgi:hypothetical protein
MSTPICRTCDTKFPGKHKCKTCGADPNAEPTLDWKIEQAKLKPKVEQLNKGMIELTKKTRLAAKQIAKAFAVPTNLILGPEEAKKMRSAHRARVRSLQNTKTSGRRYKHGRVGVR